MQDKNLYTSYELTLALMVTLDRKIYHSPSAEKYVSMSKKFLSQTEEGKKRIKRFRSTFGKKATIIGAGIFAPGVLHHLVLRKRFVEAEVNTFLAEHPEGQVVNIGAGLDALLSIVSEAYPAAQFFEVDYESVAQLKRSVVNASNLEFLGGDLSKKSAIDMLLEAGFDPKKPSLFIIEAVLMYLPESEAFKLITDVLNVSSSHGKLICSFLDHGLKEFRGMRRNNSEFSWSMSPGESKTKLEQLGFCVLNQVGDADIQRMLLESGPYPKKLFDKEYFLVLSN